jgi:hypothetical protein
MRFVPTKTVEQQSCLVLHRTRHLFIRQQIPRFFRSGRDFSAWIGLVPKQHSSGGKDKLGNISKQGDRRPGLTRRSREDVFSPACSNAD